MVDSYGILLDKISVIYRTKTNVDLHFEFTMFCLPHLVGEWLETDKFETMKIGSYRYNYVFNHLNKETGEIEEGALYIGISCNSPAGSEQANRCRMKLEWNPQKVTPPQALRNWMMSDTLRMQYYKVQKCDVALDFPGLDLSALRYNTLGDTMVYGSKTEKTYYLRPAARHGRVKIYDKKKEREKLGEVIPQTLRVEMTLEHPEFHERVEIDRETYGYLAADKDWKYVCDVCEMFSEVKLPTRFVTLQYDLEEKYGKYDQIYLWALKHASPEEQDEILAMMSVATRAKYRAALMSGDYRPIQIDPMMFCDVVSRMINDAILLVPSSGGVLSDSKRFSK